MSLHFRHARPAFSMIELVIVVVILGVIASIAIPRFSNAAQRSENSAVLASTRILNQAVEHYVAEHADRCPATAPDGQIINNPLAFQKRLLGKTDDIGRLNTGIFGPYLREFPMNPKNGLATLRIDGDPAGANLAGWRFDSKRGIIVPDDSGISAAMAADVILGANSGWLRRGGSAAVGAGGLEGEAEAGK
jgi:prepilin-type N-terminal cleavage/methylation domain-containing protein